MRWLAYTLIGFLLSVSSPAESEFRFDVIPSGSKDDARCYQILHEDSEQKDGLYRVVFKRENDCPLKFAPRKAIKRAYKEGSHQVLEVVLRPPLTRIIVKGENFRDTWLFEDAAENLKKTSDDFVENTQTRSFGFLEKSFFVFSFGRGRLQTDFDGEKAALNFFPSIGINASIPLSFLSDSMHARVHLEYLRSKSFQLSSSGGSLGYVFLTANTPWRPRVGLWGVFQVDSLSQNTSSDSFVRGSFGRGGVSASFDLFVPVLLLDTHIEYVYYPSISVEGGSVKADGGNISFDRWLSPSYAVGLGLNIHRNTYGVDTDQEKKYFYSLRLRWAPGGRDQ